MAEHDKGDLPPLDRRLLLRKALPRDGAATTHTHQDGSVWGGPWCGLHTAGERPVAARPDATPKEGDHS